MGTAKIRKIASLCKSEFVNKALVGKHARGAVRVIRGTELPIRRARGATGDTVATTVPGPPDRVTDRDVDCARVERKGSTWPHHHIDSRASCRWDTVNRWPAVLIDNADGWRARSAGRSCASLARFSPHQKSCRNENCHPKN